MRKLLLKLIALYNAKSTDPIQIREAKVYKLTATSTLAISALKKESPVFYKNILREKQYDLRQRLFDEIYKDDTIEEFVYEEGNELTLTSEIRIYER